MLNPRSAAQGPGASGRVLDVLSLCQPEGTAWGGQGAGEPTVPPETLQGAWVWAPESALCLPKLFFWCSCPPRGPGARDNAHNQIVSSRNSQSTLDSEQELEQQEHAELTEVIALSPEEAKRLLVSGRWPCSILAPLRAQDGGGHRERPMPLRCPVPWGRGGGGRPGP